MKLNNTILKTGALAGVLAAAPFFTNVQSAEAAPKKEAKREVRESRRDVKEAKRDLKEARKDLRDDKRDLNRNNNWNNGRNNNWNNRNNNWNNGRNNNWNNRPTQRSFTGTVISEARNAFTLNSGASFLTVNTSGSVPQRISRGDLVQVTGVQTGSTFRASSIRILRNR